MANSYKIRFLILLSLIAASSTAAQGPAAGPSHDGPVHSPSPSPTPTPASSPSPVPTPFSPQSPIPMPSPTPSAAPSAPAPAPATLELKGSSRGLSGGQKAGIVLGVFAAAGVIGCCGMVYRKRRANIRRNTYGVPARRPEIELGGRP